MWKLKKSPKANGTLSLKRLNKGASYGRKKKYPFYEMYFKKEWSYTKGAVLLVILALALVVVTGSAWGVTSPLGKWGGKFLQFIGINADSWKAYNGSLATYNFWTDQTSLTDLGIVLGAFLSVLLATQFKIKKLKV